MRRILVVDDEKKLVEVIRAYLAQEGFEVAAAYDGLSALEQVRLRTPDLVILDLMLPGLNGEEVCKRLREYGDIPVLMLTAKSTEDDRVRGLNLGADDYLVKPFSPRELVARVHAIFRRIDRTDANKPVFKFGDGYLVIDQDRHEVFVDGNEIALTPTEFRLLSILARRPGRVFSRSELAELVQGYEYDGYDNAIYVHIKNLRHKIEPNPEQPVYIKTVYGVGYKFDASGSGR